MRTSCIGRGCRGERQETVSRGWRKRKPIEGLGERRIFASDDIVRLILDCTVGSGSRRPEATSLSVLITAGIRRYGKSVAGAAQNGRRERRRLAGGAGRPAGAWPCQHGCCRSSAAHWAWRTAAAELWHVVPVQRTST